ncbi:hypothetical protein ACIQ1D_19020 [Lysinibacillus xylanilyticus]|uniref:hypothetical protein n=1 Tax=Lysinibacillus xylanilyticus TaxID=582475 RepID=UPI00382B14B7
MTNNFQIGDLIVGTEESNRYGITCKEYGVVGEVVNIYSDNLVDNIKIKIVEHRDAHHIGKTFLVNGEHFELKKPASTEAKIQKITQEFMQEKETLNKAMETYDKNTTKILENLKSVASETKTEKVETTNPNKTRKETIEVAKKLVENNKQVVSKCYRVDVTYVVNEEKRTVVAIGRGYNSGIVRFKAVAKCNPNDVFNAHIGKAIALGRLVDIDITEFVEVPQPVGIVAGQEVVLGLYPTQRYKVVGEKGFGKFNVEGVNVRSKGWEFEKNLVVVSDTNANY